MCEVKVQNLEGFKKLSDRARDPNVGWDEFIQEVTDFFTKEGDLLKKQLGDHYSDEDWKNHVVKVSKLSEQFYPLKLAKIFYESEDLLTSQLPIFYPEKLGSPWLIKQFISVMEKEKIPDKNKKLIVAFIQSAHKTIRSEINEAENLLEQWARNK